MPDSSADLQPSPSDLPTVPPSPGVAGAEAGALPPTPATGPSISVVPQPPGYEILEELGRGGMAVVYKARDRRLARTVALKMILAGAHAGPGERARFRTEAEAIARVQHPDIVQIYEVGEHDGLPFLSLEFCPGGNLEQALAGTPLAAPEAAAVLERLARAVAAAHAVGVVHRDLKPANVLLAAGGTPKITDFGLAKQEGISGQTASGAVVGTPSYMAPEQAAGKGQQVGAAADVYALGALLYELLTGRPPFKAATPLDTLLQVVHDEPVPVRHLQPKVPRDLETICHKCLQKEPRKRYRSAALLAEDLRRFRTGEPIQARPVGRIERTVKWVKRNAVVTGATLAVVLALTLGTAVSYRKYLDAEQQKGIAEEQRNIAQEKETEARQEAEKAKKARDFLARMFRLDQADLEGGEVSARRVLESAERRIPGEFADQPEFCEALVADIRRVRLAAAGTTPHALLLEVRGPVALQTASGATKPVVPQALLQAGDRLRLGAEAQAQLVFLSDLHKERLKSASEITVRPKGCEPADAIRERDTSALMTFVRLPKGTFYMGWNGTKGSARKTEIQEEFEIAVHDVTQGQWQAVMGTNRSHFSRRGNGRTAVLDISDEELKLFPVEMVSWTDAQEFIKKLNEKERGRGHWYRLPTEAEWEYACRGGAVSEEECSYHFYFDKPANDLSSEQANFNGTSPFGNAPHGKYLQRTTRVGAYPSNKLGLCDMHGNVWQWCADEFQPGGSDRVIRGGTWVSRGFSCQAAIRGREAPTTRYANIGFRLVRVPAR
jgi:formylglycine-generating enzyme required for sulfatase activity/tRNA A-37 threonylcarbamoyl transferase component Bud32